MQELVEQFGRRAKRDEPMSQHTTFRIGGPAEVLVDVETAAELVVVLALARDRGKPLTVIGRGANVLVRDEGIPGIVVRLAGEFLDVLFNEDTLAVLAGAGASLGRLVARTVERGWDTFAWAAGIPGTVGGALLMNAGSWGQTFGTFVESLDVVTRDGQSRNLRGEEIAFDYRSASLPIEQGIIIGVTLRHVALDLPKDAEAMKAEYLAQKLRTQPLKDPSAGCVFRNLAGAAAGALIDRAGCKGMRVGGAEVSAKHANYIVNTGGATAADVLALIDRVRERVREESGIELELELKLIP